MSSSKHVFIIAEIGSVHDGSYGNAINLIKLAKDCGADAVKFQTHIAEEETVRNAPEPLYFSDEPRYEYFQRTGFSKEQWMGLKTTCDAVDIEFMSSPFSEKAVEILEHLDMQRYKVPSGEITNVPMLRKICETGKPLLLSTGMSNWQEIDSAVATIHEYGNELTVMQCSSQYPCASENVGLNVVSEMRERYATDVGFSDHTETNYAAYAAAALGIVALEKHLTFSRSMYGSDAQNAAEPERFRELVQGVREIESMLSNHVDKNNDELYKDMKHIFQKSVVAHKDIKRGDRFTRENIAVKKPGTGIPPEKLDSLVGRVAARNIDKDTVIKLCDFADE